MEPFMSERLRYIEAQRGYGPHNIRGLELLTLLDNDWENSIMIECISSLKRQIRGNGPRIFMQSTLDSAQQVQINFGE
jgi:hypothetical protein